MIPSTTNFQNIIVLEGDKTLEKAISKQGLKNVLDYENTNLEKAFSFCRNFRTAIDVGANYGVLTYHMAKKFNNVQSFEIVNDVRYCLEQNVKKFNLHNVSVHPCGLGEREESVALNYNPTSTFSTHIAYNEQGNSLIKSLDSFNFEDVDFIKMDVEGFESFVVCGGLTTIEKYKPVILYERKIHSERYDNPVNGVLDLLSPIGYEELDYIGSKNALIGVIDETSI